MSSETRVIILGAGCSENCGYPSGKKLAAQLEDFQTEISGRFPTVEECVRETISLAKEFPQFETLDQLTESIEDNYSRLAQMKGLMGYEAEIWCDKHLTNAKIAVSTMFLSREQKARETGLKSYEMFLASLFGGGKWHEIIKSDPNCHVLSFNYDRLFEIAFLKYFQSSDFGSVSPYGDQVLNSGFNHPVNGGFDKIEPATRTFSFLKLHGSAGWWVKRNLERTNQPCFCPVIPPHPASIQEIEDLLAKHGVHSFDSLNRRGSPITFPWEPLIVFPHEKQRSLEKKRSNFAYGPYICQVWDCAANLLASATEVRIIGYSFSAIDSRHMVKALLSKATKCEKIVIQNPAVQNVRAALASYTQLTGRLEFDVALFGENV